MTCQSFHTVSRMRENCTYGSMRGRTYPAGASRPTLPPIVFESAALRAKYNEEVEKLNTQFSHSNSKLQLTIGGRLGQYKYFDMDKSIQAALELKLEV